MKICFIAPGDMEIPTNGWGALETVVWNQKLGLETLGHDVLIINDQNTEKVYHKIISFNPDVVHLHYGRHYELLPHIHTKKIVTNHDGSFLYSKKFHENIIRNFMYDCSFFILTSWEKSLLEKIGFPLSDIKILPNGVDSQNFRFTSKPKFHDKSICLGKIDNRKNQAYIQKLMIGVVFAGQNNDVSFNPMNDDYIGQWNRKQVLYNLTEYSNLVLLSKSELQPLVCLEAMSAGLGLVISEVCAQNLDESLPFINIIPESKLNDDNYIKQKVIENREYCNSIDRNIIKNYAEKFNWTNITKQYNQYIS